MRVIKYDAFLTKYPTCNTNSLLDTPLPRIAIFASGNGSNAENIITYFKAQNTACVSCVLCNKPDAYVLERAANHQIPTLVFNKQELGNGTVLHYLQSHQIQWVVLAGFLWLVPQAIVAAYMGHIVNIHPALLPAYGGKGMYGMRVHQAVHQQGEKQTGITIHHVNNHYDEGSVIFQATTAIAPDDTPETIAQKVHALEHAHFAKVLERLIRK